MSDLSENQLDELAKRIAAQLQSQEEAKANVNPNQGVLDALSAHQARKAEQHSGLVQSLVGNPNEPVPPFRTSGGGEVGGLGS